MPPTYPASSPVWREAAEFILESGPISVSRNIPQNWLPAWEHTMPGPLVCRGEQGCLCWQLCALVLLQVQEHRSFTGAWHKVEWKDLASITGTMQNVTISFGLASGSIPL